MRPLIERAVWWGVLGAALAHGVVFGLAGVALTPADARAVESADWRPARRSYWHAHTPCGEPRPLQAPPAFEPWQMPWRPLQPHPFDAFIEHHDPPPPKSFCCSGW